MTGYAGAIQMPNTNCFVGRGGQQPRYVIIHGTAGGSSAQNIATYFQSTQGTSNPVSATYAVGQDGVVVQCNSESDGAWANGALTTGHDVFWNNYAGINPNNITISIECVKADVNNASALTSAQFSSLVKLVNDICQRWGIPKQTADASGGITGHYSLDPVNRQDCPGTFDWNAFYSALQGENEVTQAEYDNVVKQLNDLRAAWNIVVPEKNGLVAEVATLKGQLATTQGKLTTLQAAWDKVVPQKNALVGQVAQLQQQLTQAQAQAANSNTAALLKEIGDLSTQLSDLNTEIQQFQTTLQAS